MHQILKLRKFDVISISRVNFANLRCTFLHDINIVVPLARSGGKKEGGGRVKVFLANIFVFTCSVVRLADEGGWGRGGGWNEEKQGRKEEGSESSDFIRPRVMRLIKSRAWGKIRGERESCRFFALFSLHPSFSIVDTGGEKN